MRKIYLVIRNKYAGRNIFHMKNFKKLFISCYFMTYSSCFISGHAFLCPTSTTKRQQQTRSGWFSRWPHPLKLASDRERPSNTDLTLRKSKKNLGDDPWTEAEVWIGSLSQCMIWNRGVVSVQESVLEQHGPLLLKNHQEPSQGLLHIFGVVGFAPGDVVFF